MSYEIELPTYYATQLKYISEYVEMSSEDIIKSCIIIHIDEFIEAMDNYIKEEFYYKDE